MTEQDLEQYLRLYRLLKSQADTLRLDIAAWQDIIDNDHDDAIEAGVFHSPGNIGMPSGNATSDATASIGTVLPDVLDQSIARLKLRQLERHVARVDAWMSALDNRGRVLLDMVYIKGMVWGEVVYTYNRNPTDGIPRYERTLRRWKEDALKAMLKLANNENDRDLTVI